MADFNLANQPGASFRAELNNIISDLQSSSYGSTAPTTTTPGQFWVDTTGANPVLKIRNSADSAWVSIGTINTAWELPDDTVTRAMIANAIMSGDDATLVTGTAGTNGNLSQWNADGDLVDGPAYGTSGANTVLQLDGSGDLPALDGSNLTGVTLTIGAPVATTSGTSVTLITGIPAGVSQAHVIFSNLSPSGNTDRFLIQFGDSGGFETTGYTSSAEANNSSNGFIMDPLGDVGDMHGVYSFYRADTANTWVGQLACRQGSANTGHGGGTKQLSGALTQIRIITETGTDSFDAGSVTVSYQ